MTANPEDKPTETDLSEGKRAAVSEEETLRILRVASDVYPDVMGGVGIHTHEMSKQQAGWGHEVTVLTSDHGNRSKPYKEIRDGYEIRRHREIVSPLDNSIFPGLVQSLKRMAPEYDVVHAHSHLFFSTNVAAAFRYLDDTPLIVTNHGLISQTAPKWLQKAFIPTIARFTLNSADRILCYSETDERRLQEQGIETEVSVVRNGIDCETFTPMDIDNDEELQILFVGRLKPGKGIDKLLIAFKNIIHQYPQVKLKIIGEGPMRDELVKEAKASGISTNIEFAGLIENKRMPKVYSQSDIFTLPSMNEGLPRTVLEAMSCEVPVVVSDLEQLRPVVKGAGITVPRNDPDALSSALLELIHNNAKRQKMGEVGRKKVKNKYSWKETVRETIKVYRDLQNQSGDIGNEMPDVSEE